MVARVTSCAMKATLDLHCVRHGVRYESATVASFLSETRSCERILVLLEVPRAVDVKQNGEQESEVDQAYRG